MSKPTSIKDIFKIGGIVVMISLVIFVLKLYATGAESLRAKDKDNIMCDAIAANTQLDNLGNVKVVTIQFDNGEIEVDCGAIKGK